MTLVPLSSPLTGSSHVKAMYSGAKSSVQVIAADGGESWVNCEVRAVWVMRAVSEISGDVAAVGSRTLTATMSPTAAPAQNGHAAG